MIRRGRTKAELACDVHEARKCDARASAKKTPGRTRALLPIEKCYARALGGLPGFFAGAAGAFAGAGAFAVFLSALP